MLSILVTLAESIAFMIGGSFGTGLPTATAFVIIIQLLIGGIMVILLDELVQKGWGLGSGISLFIAAGVAQSIFWNTFSLVPTGESYFGVIPHVIGYFISCSPEIGQQGPKGDVGSQGEIGQQGL